MPLKPAYRAAWAAAGYGPRMGSAEAVLPPPKDFIRVYYLTSAEYAISNISLRRLKVARFADLNDPFELLSPNFAGKRARKAGAAFKLKFGEQLGLICFSSDWKNPVLWSHYAAKHKGVCLGFDLKRGLERPVEYQAERIAGDFEDGAWEFDQALRDRLICTKFAHWSYEQELRVIVALKDMQQEAGLHFHPFGPDLRLSEVILGPNCPLSVDAVRGLIQKLHGNAITFKARLAFKFFEVVPDGRTVP